MCLEPDEDELTGLQEDMNVSISALKATVGGASNDDCSPFVKNNESADAISIKKASSASAEVESSKGKEGKKKSKKKLQDRAD